MKPWMAPKILTIGHGRNFLRPDHGEHGCGVLEKGHLSMRDSRFLDTTNYERQRQLDEARFSAQCELRKKITDRVLGQRDLFALKMVDGQVMIDVAASRKRVREVMEAIAREGGTTMAIPYDERPCP